MSMEDLMIWSSKSAHDIQDHSTEQISPKVLLFHLIRGRIHG
jgi:hypothetical protein